MHGFFKKTEFNSHIFQNVSNNCFQQLNHMKEKKYIVKKGLL